MTTQPEGPTGSERRLTPADVRDVRFTRGTILRPGYSETEVDRFLSRVGHELSRHTQEKAELRDRVQFLEHQLGEATSHEPPSDQAVRILASAQLTADNYVAEAEEFSRQLTSDARTQYEEQLRQARESAGAIIQAAHETAAKMTRGGGSLPAELEGASVEELQEQVAYLKAFGQAVRTQLRSYLEALLTDVENEWGQAHPAALPARPIKASAQRATDPAGSRSGGRRNVAADVPPDDSRESTGDQVEVTAGR